MHTLINAECLDYLNGTSQAWVTCFCDPPDNIGLGYQTYRDRLPDEQYVDLLHGWLHLFVRKAKADDNRPVAERQPTLALAHGFGPVLFDS